MKNTFILSIAICFFFINSLNAFSQKNKTFDPNYKLLESKSKVQDKNFYLLTAMQQVPAIQQILSTNKKLSIFLKAKKAEITKNANTCGENPECHLLTFLWKDEEVKLISGILKH
ncbi:MAG: hypothetical protein B6I20_06990 [Bacteroidetes bacterium 4572_117]|nr:MAG: hypothetical protein B6I20_06990 [Bacteroidetes bacterium 4572_117]